MQGGARFGSSWLSAPLVKLADRAVVNVVEEPARLTPASGGVVRKPRWLRGRALVVRRGRGVSFPRSDRRVHTGREPRQSATRVGSSWLFLRVESTRCGSAVASRVGNAAGAALAVGGRGAGPIRNVRVNGIGPA